MLHSPARIALFLLALLFQTPVLKGQCLSDAEITGKVTTIVNHPSDSYSEKIEKLKKLQAAFLKCNPARNNIYAQIVHKMGDMYGKANDLERAIFYTREATQANLSKNPGTVPAFLTHSYYNLGIFYKRIHLLRESHHYFGLCISNGRQFPEKFFIVFMAYEQQAYAYFQTGDYQKSAEVANDGLLFAEEHQDELAKAPLLAQKAQSEAELEHLEEAEADIRTSISLLEASGKDPVHLATAYSIYASLLNKKKNVTAALIYYHKAFDLNKLSNNLEQCSRDLLDMGRVYLEGVNQGSKALACYREGIKMAAVQGDHYQLAGLYSNIGVVYWTYKDYPKALKYYQQALNVLPLNFRDTAISSNLSPEMLKLVSNDYFVSTILANKGASLLGLFQKNRNRKTLKLALETYEIADHAVDIMRWKQYGEESKLVWRKKTKQMYAEAIEVCYQLGDIEKAYYFFEKSRAVLLNDKLSELVAASHISASDRRTEKVLRVKTYAYSQKLLSLSKKDKHYGEIHQAWQTAQDRWEDFIRSLEKKYPVYYHYKYDNTVYAYADVKEQLSDHRQSLIEYFTGDSSIYILHLSPSGQQLKKITWKNYNAEANELLALCADPNSMNRNYDRYRRLAYQLYLKLFKPLQVAEGRVIISPDETFIPFEALLRDNKLPGSFLAKNYVFSYVHSMRVLMKKFNHTADTLSFLGVAPVHYDAALQLSPLPGSGQSLKKIAPGFGNSRILTGSNASRSQFLKNAASYSILQIYAHADADESLKEPVLYLADSAVYLSEIQKLTFPKTDLVVLSACNTGIGHHARGEGVFSMARAFMIAGVPSALTNLWEVDNQVTYKLTENFYSYLQQGLSKDVALNKAKLDFLEEGDKLYDLPCYWAATIVIGNTDSLVEPEVSSFHFVLMNIAGLCLLALTGFFILRKTFQK